MEPLLDDAASYAWLEPNPAIERRLVYQLMEVWRDLRSEKIFPTDAEATPDGVGERWAKCFAARFESDGSLCVVRAGRDVLEMHGRDVLGKSDAEIPHDSVLGRALALKQAVLRKKAPISVSDSFMRDDGCEIFYRVSLMPLSEDQRRIDGVLGALSFKVVAPGASPPSS